MHARAAGAATRVHAATLPPLLPGQQPASASRRCVAPCHRWCHPSWLRVAASCACSWGSLPAGWELRLSAALVRSASRRSGRTVPPSGTWRPGRRRSRRRVPMWRRHARFAVLLALRLLWLRRLHLTLPASVLHPVMRSMLCCCIHTTACLPSAPQALKRRLPPPPKAGGSGEHAVPSSGDGSGAGQQQHISSAEYVMQDEIFKVLDQQYCACVQIPGTAADAERQAGAASLCRCCIAYCLPAAAAGAAGVAAPRGGAAGA